MAKITKLDHALHNQEACNHLTQEERFADWVVITAFYSAIHFVDHQIFPIKGITTQGQKFTIANIDQYRNALAITKEKHAVRGDLVRQKCATINAKFEWLKSACWTARYTTFIVDNPTSTIEKTQKYLDAIKDFCDPSIIEE